MNHKIGLGIDVGSKGLKFAMIYKTESSYKFLNAAFYPFLAPLEQEILPENAPKLKAFLKEKDLKHRSGVVGISGHNLNIRYLNVPPAPDWRLEKIIGIEVGEISSQTDQDFAYDYRLLNLPKTSKEGTDYTVMLALSRDPFVDQLTLFFKKAGISVNYMTSGALALYNAFIKWAEYKQKETIYILDMGYENTETVICQKGQLCFAKNIGGGGKLFVEAVLDNMGGDREKAEAFVKSELDLTPADDQDSEGLSEQIHGATNHLFTLLDSNLKFAKNEIKLKNIEIDRLIISGGISQQKGLRQYLMSRFSRPAEFFDPSKQIDLSESGEKNKEIIEQEPGRWAIALGLAQMDTDESSLSLKLVAKRYKKIEEFMNKAVFEYISIVLAVLLLLISFFLMLSYKNSQKEASLRVKEKYTQIERIAKEIDSLTQQEQGLKIKENLLKSKIRVGHDLLLVLSLLRQTMPMHVSLKSVEIQALPDDKDDAPVFKISGSIEESEEDVFTVLKSFQNILEKHQLVKECKAEDPKHDVDEGKLEFKFQLQLKP